MSNQAKDDELREKFQAFIKGGHHACYCDYSTADCSCAIKDEYLDEMMAFIKADRLASERKARIDEHKVLWEIVPSDLEHIGTVKDISYLRVIKLRNQGSI